MEEGGDAVCSKSAAGIFKKSESIRRKIMQPQKNYKQFRKLEYKRSVPLKGRKVESEGEMGGVCAASQTGVNLPRLAVAQTHPNPRGSVRRLAVDRAWEIPSEHKRQIVVSRSPFVPTNPLSHHHLLLLPQPRTSYFH